MENTEISQEEIDKEPSKELNIDHSIRRKRGRKRLEQTRQGRQSNPTNEDLKPVPKKEQKTFCPSLEELEEMPLDTHEDYKRYNDAVRQRRRSLRVKDVEFLYAPLDKVKCTKATITRTNNRGKPIKINLRKLKHAVWFQSPKDGFKDGEEIVIPECLINEINKIAEPKYRQEKYPDGSHATVLDYWENKYNVQPIMDD